MKLNKEKLLQLYSDYTSVLGPYSRPDGRKHIVLNNNNLPTGSKGKTKTISYPKALKEVEIGRRLNENETVDHNDRNFNNNRGTNLNIKNRSEHSTLDALRVEVLPVKCALLECNNVFIPTKSQRNKQSSGLNGFPAGPFYSKSCRGKYGASVQNGGEKIERSNIEKIYYRKDK